MLVMIDVSDFGLRVYKMCLNTLCTVLEVHPAVMFATDWDFYLSETMYH